MSDAKTFNSLLTARRWKAVVYALSGILGKGESAIESLIKQNMLEACENAFASHTLVLSEDSITYRAKEITWAH
ncbi:hypothetical protein RRF57_010106 [Xylaria bambusicola]|uniref:Uncharacterized protein n=1 Tax=Xylaria bambusicola TaxID=326684 RepID=A0AAN7URY8_9PEZI